MVSIIDQKGYRSARRLPFCYLCGEVVRPGEDVDRDHVPPKSAFAAADREPLVLQTHRNCNQRHSAVDEKVGQLIGMINGVPLPKRSEWRLDLVDMGGSDWGGITNFLIDRAVYRWISGFHAALYREPLIRARLNIVLPFVRADLVNGNYVVAGLDPSHAEFVEALRYNRLRGNTDRIYANKGRLRYECVWATADDLSTKMCIFGIDLYGWKKLGTTPLGPARGCAGCYIMPNLSAPAAGTLEIRPRLKLPGATSLDPFD